MDFFLISRLRTMLDDTFHLSSDTLTAIRLTISQKDLPIMKLLEKPNILLLGPGETGKTTLVKQIVKSCLNSSQQFYSDCERAEYISHILCNVSATVEQLLDIIAGLGQNLKTFENVLIDLLDVLDDLDLHAEKISSLYQYEEKFHLVSAYRHLDLPAHVNYYFLDALPRILKKHYLPSDQDIIQCHIMTTGIHPTLIDLRGSAVSLVDFGGQFSERKKWINWFQKAGLIIFVASISDYNEVCAENPLMNRMDDAIELFDNLVHSKWFVGVSIILLLNKTDVFAHKFQEVDFTEHFPDYTGGANHDAACVYIKNKYLSKAPADTRVYFTSAVDEKQILGMMYCKVRVVRFAHVLSP
ncbi:guanine nucleotide binding protein, alpha subunit [Lentinula raphanica]|nr:guanine nucleotide binding protein, alpha subunit [Lentinula raphanica]